MNKILALFVFQVLVLVAAKRRFVDPVKYAKADANKPYNYTMARTDPIFPVDHFGYTNTDKFSLRYLYNDKYYVKGSAVFFYAGNEGGITGFADNTGIVWDLAPQFKAMVVFAEHRYYGDSMPYASNASWSDIKRLGYLSSAQALADYAMFLPWFRSKHNVDPASKVIVFGGSYGGMLATWFRLKYPALTVGAWASSAPVTYFSGGGVPVGGFDSVVRDTYLASGCQNQTIAAAFAAVTNLGNSADGRKQLNTIFKMDPATQLNTFQDVVALKLYIQIGMEYMAMTDYPYPSNFLQPMPAWPVSEACKRFGKVSANSAAADLAAALFDASNVYYNYNNDNRTTCLDTSKCSDQSMGALSDGPDGWDFQECTEIIIEMCSLGQPNDFFDQDCKDNASFINFQNNLCTGIYGAVGWKPEFMNIDGVKNLYGWDFSQATNIIFTNGKYDPWSIGGVKVTTPGIKDGQKRGIYTFMIDGSAHHLDLRQPMSCDPHTVVNARFQIVQIMNCWLNSGTNCPFTPTSLPEFQPVDATNCAVQVGQYPWGQQNPQPTDSTSSSSTVTSTSTSTSSTSVPVTTNAPTLTLKLTFSALLFRIFVFVAKSVC